MSLSIYFAEREGLIKIGCSLDPRRRVAQLGRAELVAVIPNGSYRMEAELHQVFADSRVDGEWFLDCPEIQEVIAQYRVSGLPTAVAVPTGRGTYYVRSDLATWAELTAGLRDARYARRLNRLRPYMEHDPAMTVAEALRREQAAA